MEEEILTDKEFENFEKLLTPRCVSVYRTDLHSYKGCVFYDGENLCVLDTPWRKDDVVCISEMHQREIEMAKDTSKQIAHGIPAKILTYILINYPGYYQPHVDEKFLKYLSICGDEYVEEGDNFMFMTNIDTEDLYLIHWADFLSIDFKNPKSGEMSLNWEAIILMASEYIEALYKKSYKSEYSDQEPDADLSIRVRINGYQDPLVLSTNKLWESIRLFEKYDSLPIYSIDLLDFQTWRYYDDAGFYKRCLLGFCAYTSALAIAANKMRPLTEVEAMALFAEEHDENEKNETSDTVEENFCNFNYVNSLIRRPVQEGTDIDEDSLSILNLKSLLFTIDVPKKQLFEDYIKILSPSWKYIIAKLPTFPEALNQEEVFYSFLLLTEQSLLAISQHSILWKTLEPCQQKILSDYSLRFQAFLKSEYNANIEQIQKVLNEDFVSFMDLLAIHPDTIDIDDPDIQTTSSQTNLSEQQTPHWPYYTSEATDSDKQFFEKQLKNLCTSTKRTATKYIKAYLKLKQDDKIITRPEQTNEEWEILKAFGYNKTKKAYYNAN